MKVPILYRHAESGLIEPVESEYSGPVMTRVWKNMNRQLLKLDAGSYFFPCDALDAYAEAVNKVEETAGRIVRGEIVLNKASPVTYLTGVAYKAYYRFHLRQVQPQRELYRRVESKTCGRGAVGEDGFDIDIFVATQGSPSKKMCGAFGVAPDVDLPVGSAMTAQQLAESLPGIPWARERHERAVAALAEIYAALERGGADGGRALPVGRLAAKAFRAYVMADCDMVLAARIAGVSKTDFYRKWPTWLAVAKKLGKKSVPRGTN